MLFKEESVLEKKEYEILKKRVHWGTLIVPIIISILIVLVYRWAANMIISLEFLKPVDIFGVNIPIDTYVIKTVDFIFLALFVYQMFQIVKSVIRLFDTELILTSKRLVVKTGLLKRRKYEIPLLSIQNIMIEQHILALALMYGTINVHTPSGSVFFTGFSDPSKIKEEIFNQKDSLNITNHRDFIDEITSNPAFLSSLQIASGASTPEKIFKLQRAIKDIETKKLPVAKKQINKSKNKNSTRNNTILNRKTNSKIDNPL